MSRLLGIAFALILVGCSENSIVEPGPGEDALETTTTTLPQDDSETDLEVGGDEDDVETEQEVPPTSQGDVEDDTIGGPLDGDDGDADVTATTVVIDETSENASAFTDLAASGLVLSLDEQSCADDAAADALVDGADSVDVIVVAVQNCASAATIDDFASGLIEAGGGPLPPTEAACVSSQLQATEEFRPFWRALLDEEPFDFLLAETEVQNRFLDLYSRCVSVGRAVQQQSGTSLSPTTQGCIDNLYNDREFVRVTILADLSGDAEERARIDGQIATCLTSDELAALGGN